MSAGFVKDEQHFLFDSPHNHVSFRGQHFRLLEDAFRQGDIRLFFQATAGQLGLVACRFHLCLQGRKMLQQSDEAHPPPCPGAESMKMKMEVTAVTCIMQYRT